ncbi:DUF2332 domain-containing protein [Histidinibacterium aquaticum]|uniref:DUF2332 domain-containing protein n=1 Tax=Histidinibacterium aquaticum TaxID=2613962 RepID=A0A5J5GJL2_9RHOB|nr:DUF2332 family protein [Histidinibacterium aquaticum]KAA9008335.1 DUF2332 domain-containing protein [Histidinibacterium aquaticum]
MSEDRFRSALRQQAASCANLGSPFMERLCRLFAERLQPGTELTDRLFDWPGELGPMGDSVPLRLTGAMHAQKLSGTPGLAEVYPPHEVEDDVLWRAVDRVMRSHHKELGRFIDLPPQTNEVRRSASLIAAAHWLGARYPMPLTLSELGASAGLNLMFDRYGLETPEGPLGAPEPVLTLDPDWTGPVPGGPSPRAVGRRGVDLSPLDPTKDRLRLLAYLWPDQPHRLTLTEKAISVAEAKVDAGDAADWLEARLAEPHEGLHLVYHTIAWQYFPEETQRRLRDALEAAGSRATPEAPLAWFGMEADGEARGSGLTLRLWPGGETHRLGRFDFHGRWIDWTAAPL